MLPKGFWLLVLLLAVLSVVFEVLALELDYFSDSDFLMTACIDSPSLRPKVESSVSSLRILPDSISICTFVDKLDVGKRSRGVGLGSQKNFEFFDIVGVAQINVKDERLLAGGDFEADFNHF